MAHILVIDDEREIRDAVSMALEQSGHRVTVAENGKVGMSRFHADPADLVVTDLLMPEQEGMETIVQLRRSHPQVGIIAMSGGGARTDIYLQICVRLGVTNTLSKPFSIAELNDAVTQALSASRGDSGNNRKTES